jgi:hypothetical protein
MKKVLCAILGILMVAGTSLFAAPVELEMYY